VVIGLVVPEPELLLVAPDPEPELELVVPDPEPELVAPDPELDPLDAFAATVLFWDSAGSLPDTSWTKMTAQSTAKVTSVVAITRLRILVTRCRWARSRSPAIARTSAAGGRRGAAAAGGYSWSIGTSIGGWLMRWAQNRPPTSVRREKRLRPTYERRALPGR
jgi:hypothetical protein